VGPDNLRASAKTRPHLLVTHTADFACLGGSLDGRCSACAHEAVIGDTAGSTLDGVSAGAWIGIFVVAGVAIGFVLLWRRQRQEASLKEWITDQPVLFTTRALVRIRASGAEGFGWRTVRSRGRARLVVHGGGIEVTIGRGDGFISGNSMRASDATMWRDRIGWGGSFIRKRDCVRLHGFNGRTTSDWAVTPRETSLDEVWQALLAVGVTPAGPTG
jgi:hypothetical protein